MAGRRKSDEMKRQIVGVAATGQSFSAVGVRFGITEVEISRLVAKNRQTGNLKNFPRSDHPKATKEKEDRLIVQHCRRHRFKPARQVRDDLQGVIGRLSRQTINNRLLAANLPSRRPRKKLELTQQHRQYCQSPCSLEHQTSEDIHVNR